MVSVEKNMIYLLKDSTFRCTLLSNDFSATSYSFKILIYTSIEGNY